MDRNQTASVDSSAADHVWIVLGTEVIDASCSSSRLRGLLFMPDLCLEHEAIVSGRCFFLASWLASGIDAHIFVRQHLLRLLQRSDCGSTNEMNRQTPSCYERRRQRTNRRRSTTGAVSDTPRWAALARRFRAPPVRALHSRLRMHPWHQNAWWI